MKLSQKEIEQVKRIKDKMANVLICDRTFKNFGAENHKYIWNKPCSEEDIIKFEKDNEIELPRSYRIFLSEVSNGGPFFGYGLYSLSETRIYACLKKESIFYESMTQEEFVNIQRQLDKKDNIDDSNYDGLLIIGTKGSTYDFAIVITGKYRGRVLLTDGNMEGPFYFVKDEEFLDYYERWMDDMIAGMNMISFDISYPGDEEELINKFKESKDPKEQFYLFMSIIRFKEPSDGAIDLCFNILNKDYDSIVKELSFIRLYKYRKESFFEVLDKYLYGSEMEKYIAIKIIGAIGNNNSQIEKYFNRLKDIMYESSNFEFERISGEEVTSFNRICIILSENKKDSIDIYLPFFTHEREDIRAFAIWSAGKVINARFFPKEFITGLKDDSPRVVVATVQAIQSMGVFQKDLMPYLKESFDKFPDDKYFVRSSIASLLKSWGFSG